MDGIELLEGSAATKRGAPEMPPPLPPPAPSDSTPAPGSVFQPASRNHGRPWIWSTAAGLVVVAAMLVGILSITFVEGLGQFWPSRIVELRRQDGSILLGEVRDRGEKQLPGRNTHIGRRLLRVGHREVTGSNDFLWVDDLDVAAESFPRDAWVVDRSEYGRLYGTLGAVKGAVSISEALSRGADLRSRLEAVRDEMNIARDRSQLASLEKRRKELEAEGSAITIEWRQSDGSVVLTPAVNVIGAWAPNSMGVFAKLGHYLTQAWQFVSTRPRESNTEGGILPIIMGTLFLVVVMTLAAVPLGVVAAIYLNEYAREGRLLQLVRLAIANLAGVPSIVFGIFGLGLFVYTIGAGIDRAFFADRGHPTFGTGGILWGALTLALLTVPVVIVAATEGLRSVSQASRDGAMALGATRWQTIRHVVLPQAMPGILTGMILAIGRGAGEVAPLMVLGAAVKLAPQPLVDSAFPFFHLDRKFTHLGFHIYDVSMQSPNVEAAKPMTYASTLALLLLVLALNLVAIILRNRLKKRFRGSAL
ncbi:MAG: phosphate ABC transporter permease PstA [Planctomycetes bacterium]|nr:phosphate ABC transporter permease PstA [Planctomycetota bacterium]